MLKPKKIIKKTAAVILAFCLLINAGCWDRLEIDKITMSLAIGIDYLPEEDQIAYTSLVARPGLAAGGEGRAQLFMGPIWINRSTGKSIFEAARNDINQMSRAFFESHILALVVGEELARRGIGEVIDFMARQRQHRLIHPLLIVRGNAEEVLRTEPELENNIAVEIRGILLNQASLSTTPLISLKDFLIPLNKPGSDAFAPVIEIREEIPAFDEEFLPGSEEGDRVKKTLAVQGTAVFSEDKLAGFLNIPETKGLLWVHGEIIRTVLIPIEPNGGQVTVYTKRSRAKLEPEFKDNKLKMRIQVETEGDIASATIKQDIADPKVIEKLEKTLANHIKQEILMAAARSREFKSDFLHLGAAFRRKDPKKWKEFEKNWREMLPDVELEVRVIAKIRGTGLISTPLIQE